MYFVFENKDHLNLIDCEDKNISGHPRITSSPYVGNFFYGYHDTLNKEELYEYVSRETDMPVNELKKINTDPFSWIFKIISKKYVKEVTPDFKKNYIISVCVNHDPIDWAGPPYTEKRYTDRKPLFHYISPLYLERLRNKTALLIVDQTLEGYHKEWIWDWFHKQCDEYQLFPESIVYVTGNLKAPDQYQEYVQKNNITNQIKVIGFCNFELDIRRLGRRSDCNRDFNSLVEYKRNNIIKTYNCMNKRIRRHRILFFLHLFAENLTDKGLISMNNFTDEFFNRKTPFSRIFINESRKILPLQLYSEDNREKDDNFYINRIVNKVYKDSWVSLISEASYFEEEDTIFLSEKTFKPIACLHPFIIIGNRGSLKKLREMGYKTFDGFIDESYDDLSDYERFKAIIRSLKKIDAIKDKLEWYSSMKDILLHNYDVLMSSNEKIYKDYYIELKTYQDQFFGKR